MEGFPESQRGGGKADCLSQLACADTRDLASLATTSGTSRSMTLNESDKTWRMLLIY